MPRSPDRHAPQRPPGGSSIPIVLTLFASGALLADGAGDNNTATVRPIPPPGVAISEADRAALESGLAQLSRAIEARGLEPASGTGYADVAVLHRAVDVALRHDELFAPDDVQKARELIDLGLERAASAGDKAAPWRQEAGLLPLGYLSRIDGSVQPYGLIVPDSYRPQGERRHRLDIWFHGRGETLSELRFLHERTRSRGEYAPEDAFVLHPYGRYCNAFKFAGEVDVLEALADVQRAYRIDPDRISVRGFSMGGAACWQFAVHYADHWFAANPGAGFAETAQFLRIFQKETVAPTPWEQRLWHLYDCTDYAINLYHCPTVAYSGEIDSQKQAADIMEEALRAEGMELVHIIGPQAAHRIHPDSKVEIERRLCSLAERGRERLPRSVRLKTFTLKYNRMHWVTIDALGEHWKEARCEADLVGDDRVVLRTRNITELTLSIPAGWCPLDVRRPVLLEADGQTIEGPRPGSDRSWLCRLHKGDGGWQPGAAPAPPEGVHRKEHDLQGPIDDAFLDSFIFVRPTGRGTHPEVDRWARGELEHAITHWRLQFRGDPVVKDDTEVAESDLARANIVLFGDPGSNALLGKIAARLPIPWTADAIVIRDQAFVAERHGLVLIAPNPLNPRRYVVLNSGFTYREYDYLNNARQVPKLPDWAIVDIRTPPGPRLPGKVVAADFLSEQWQIRP